MWVSPFCDSISSIIRARTEEENVDEYRAEQSQRGCGYETLGHKRTDFTYRRQLAVGLNDESWCSGLSINEHIQRYCGDKTVITASIKHRRGNLDTHHSPLLTRIHRLGRELTRPALESRNLGSMAPFG